MAQALISMFDIRYRIKNAGPSPDSNRRTELYFAGCKKAASGSPCKNCFNQALWEPQNVLKKTPEEILDCLERHNIPRYITIVGGEPTDQLEGLLEFGRLAKFKGYHIILFSWHNEEWLRKNLKEGLNYFDIIIPGEYKESLRIYNEEIDDGLHNAVGSSNQWVWVTAHDILIRAGRISSLNLINDSNDALCLEVKFNDGKLARFIQYRFGLLRCQNQ